MTKLHYVKILLADALFGLAVLVGGTVSMPRCQAVGKNGKQCRRATKLFERKPQKFCGLHKGHIALKGQFFREVETYGKEIIKENRTE